MGSEAFSKEGELPRAHDQKHEITTESQQSEPQQRPRRKLVTTKFHLLWMIPGIFCLVWLVGTVVFIVTEVIRHNREIEHSKQTWSGPSVKATSVYRKKERSESTQPIGHFDSLAGPHITANFPDPCILVHDGTTYAFATNNRKSGREHVHVQIATSTDNKTWELQPTLDALPTIAPWQTGNAVWAPDVKHLPNGQFLLYYTDSLVTAQETHCIGAAVSDSVAGPYIPYPKPLVCPHGGGIDPAGFLDRPTGKRYIVYKIDGNSRGHGGLCRNDVLPIMATPLMLQEVDPNDGVTLLGSPVQLFDRDALDGPLIEAPAMYLTTEGIYFLFFSSHCFTTPLYHTTYATATNITGPYKRAARPLLITGDGDENGLGIVGPGGLDISHHSYATLAEEPMPDILTRKDQKGKPTYEKEGHLAVFHGHMTHHNMQRDAGAQRPIQDLHGPFIRGMYSGTIRFRGRLATLRTAGFEKSVVDHTFGTDNEL